MAVRDRKQAGADGRGSRGFSLLEVLIAVAILAMALSSLLVSQGQSMRATAYARELSSAALLAEYQLIEIEWQYKEDGWPSSDKEYTGNFEEQGWPDIRYECLADFLEIPEYSQLMNAKDESDQATDGDDAYTQDAGDQAFSAMGMVWPIVKQAVEDSIRKAICTVYWKNGGVEEEFTVATFWTDPARLANIASMGGGEYNSDDDSSAEDESSSSSSSSSGSKRGVGKGVGGVAPTGRGG